MHNPMKLHLITALLGFGMSAANLAAETFRVYAPAPKTQTLWIVDAVPKGDRGLELTLAEKRELGCDLGDCHAARSGQCESTDTHRPAPPRLSP